ncbi:hypothetical protein PTSG_11063 [Salpingoeca rosetta]|uniref:MalT-like TPR region domain-containing protein n=1 Tax=Salpingoeca rosetta (strain ATCC 50818 / BSB-021) TaxID=946362 RepID=F2US13_SALR5|nr:uncharacterized protein PTSG_11063 [Salpingoeca rosetta]EGD80418.1 hypothetical protein PTSG_11063 [Salpingoeca rosetta]|eukprot:XP_004987982.1 hypothetical protein PTSG_11063 [Salpingoeca rosetta]
MTQLDSVADLLLLMMTMTMKMMLVRGVGWRACACASVCMGGVAAAVVHEQQQQQQPPLQQGAGVVCDWLPHQHQQSALRMAHGACLKPHDNNNNKQHSNHDSERKNGAVSPWAWRRSGTAVTDFPLMRAIRAAWRHAKEALVPSSMPWQFDHGLHMQSLQRENNERQQERQQGRRGLVAAAVDETSRSDDWGEADAGTTTGDQPSDITDNSTSGGDTDESTLETGKLPLHLAYIIQSARHALDQEDYQKAAKLYDKAVAEAQKNNLAQSQIGALASVAGNVHFHLRHFRRAIEYFTQAVQAVVTESQGAPDARAIELSLKLAECFSGIGEADKAESGLDWCVQQARALKAASTDDDKGNADAMYGLCLEQHGLFLMGHGRPQEGRKRLLLAAECARNFKPEPVPSAAARCYIYAAQCSLAVGDVHQATMDIARAQEVCKSPRCLFKAEVQAQAKEIQRLHDEGEHHQH